MHYVYILFLSNKDLYKGSTSDLKFRVHEHEIGKVDSTRHYRPLSLIHYEAYTKKTDAERRERFLKTTEGRRFLNMQLRDLFDSLGL